MLSKGSINKKTEIIGNFRLEIYRNWTKNSLELLIGGFELQIEWQKSA